MTISTFLMTHSTVHTAILYDTMRKVWLRCIQPHCVYTTTDPSQVQDILRQIEHDVLVHGYTAVGMVNYLAAPAFDKALHVQTDTAPALPLVWFALYETVEEVEQIFDDVDVLSPDLQALLDEILLWQWEPTVSYQGFCTAINNIREHIRLGDIYQANYTMRLRAHIALHHDDITQVAWMLFRHLVSAQMLGKQAIYAAYLHLEEWIICSASPEEFFLLQGDKLTSRPMKGTMIRGVTTEADEVMKQALFSSEKNRAENVMITDMVRNDFSRIAVPGSVQVPSLFAIETYPTVLQMVSHVHCRTKVSIADILQATFPPASITGAPKPRAMEIIAETETTPRNAYTGTIGFMRRTEQDELHAQFNVAIRTATIHEPSRKVEYGVGGGIVWDSTAEDEYEECAVKSKILTHQQPQFELLETLLVTPTDGIILWSAHKQRLLASAKYFGFAVYEHVLDHWAESFLPVQIQQRVRLVVNRQGRIEVTATPIQSLPMPYRVAVAQTPIQTTNKFLYHKTTYRPMYEKARQECAFADDTILWNEHGELTESCIGNLAIERDGILYTPPVASGLLAGLWRNARIADGTLIEKVLRAQDLRECSALYLMNSVRGLWRIELVEY